MIERLLHALLGGFLGAILAVGALCYFVNDVGWVFYAFVGASFAVCGVLAFAWGEPFVEWLKGLFEGGW